MPRIPEILDTRLAPESFPSASLRSPDGRSTMRVGEAGLEGLVKAYCVSEAWRLMSMKGISVDIVTSKCCDLLYCCGVFTVNRVSISIGFRQICQPEC